MGPQHLYDQTDVHNLSEHSLQNHDYTSGTLPQLTPPAHYFLRAPVELARLKVQMEALEEIEALRTCTAIVTIILTVAIWILGARSGAALFALIGISLFAFSPNFLPRASAWIVGHLERDAIAARVRNTAGTRDD
jgi:hypothetical protein